LKQGIFLKAGIEQSLSFLQPGKTSKDANSTPAKNQAAHLVDKRDKRGKHHNLAFVLTAMLVALPRTGKGMNISRYTAGCSGNTGN
jgi:hypothetical protein